MSTSAEVEIHFNRKLLLRSLFIVVVFVGYGLWLLIADLGFLPGPRQGGLFNSRWISLITIGFGIPVASIFIAKLFKSGPAIILNREGFTDASSGHSCGFMPWSDVTGIRRYQFKSNKYVVVDVESVEQFVARGSVLQRALWRGNVRMMGSPICISTNVVLIGHFGLLQLFEMYFREYHEPACAGGQLSCSASDDSKPVDQTIQPIDSQSKAHTPPNHDSVEGASEPRKARSQGHMPRG